MPAADGAGAPEQGTEMVAPGDTDGAVASSQPQQPLEIIIHARDEQHAPEEEQAERQRLENRRQDGAGTSAGRSEPEPPDAGHGSSSQPQQGPVATIPKVREQLRDAGGGDYLFAPQTMLIGPYHEYEDYCSSPWMEDKKKAVDHIKDQIGDGHGFEELKSMLAQLWRQEVRKCYKHLPDNHYTDPVAFTSMMLHDGCFLLCLFVKFGPPGAAPGNGEENILDNTLVRDILYLLENQIPLFVLQRTLDHINPIYGMSALECASRFVKDMLKQQLYISGTAQPEPSESEPSDLLHLVYSYFRRPAVNSDMNDSRGRRTGRWRRATDYSRYAALKFKPRVFSDDGDGWTILDVHLEGGTMYIPFLQIDMTTWTMLRNLMALEEQERKQRPVTAYCFFMSQVACTAEDVIFLQRAKILEHFLGSDKQAAKGLAELCDGMALDIGSLEQNYLKPFWHDLHKRCRKPWNNFRGFFREKYCGTLFHRLVFFMALFVFITQLTQVVYAALGYHKPPK